FAKQRVFQEYASYFGMEKMEQLFSEERIRKILTLDSDIFSRDWDYIYPEFSIISPMDQKKYVLDRLMIRKAKKGKKGLVYIVDYKTGGKDPKQLENYEQILRELFKREEGEYEFQTKFLELGREGE
ncbi:MAG: ATP-dependent nuclease subunit A, partial [Fusobacterium necrophorum]|nr:ATP-dependent nuclease subunit A [Fusobacterium necrophorum]